MSKAEVDCPYCDKEWIYEGLSATSCYCPNCSGEIFLESPEATVIDSYGVSDGVKARRSSGGGDVTKPYHETVQEDEEEDYIEPSDEETELIGDLNL